MEAPESPLYEAAIAAVADGNPRAAVALVEQLLEARPHASMRAAAQRLRARLITGSRPLEAHELLVTEAGRIEPLAPAVAASMYADAALAAMSGGEGAQAMLALARADAAAIRAPEARFEVAAARAALALGRGEDFDVEALAADLAGSAPNAAGFRALLGTAAALVWAERLDAARALLTRLVEHGRTGEARDLLPRTLDTLGSVDFRCGRWRSSEARSRESLRVARELSLPFEIASALTSLARIAAVRGHEVECRAVLAEVPTVGVDNDLIRGYALTAQGMLELSLGRAEAAGAAFDGLAEIEIAITGRPDIFRWHGDAVEAYVRAGRRADAGRVLEAFERRAAESSGAWARAVAARARAIFESTDFDEHFLRALSEHERAQMPFERARTELCYGERLRRARRGREASTYLRSAVAAFRRLGARPWEERASRELGRPGRRQRDVIMSDALTPYEQAVVALVERGATNRECAAALFLSEKTIEYHLTSVYRKLQVRSRMELAHALATRRRGSA